MGACGGPRTKSTLASMRIALELGLNTGTPRGADVYFQGLVQGLTQLPPKHQFLLFSYFYRDYEKKAAAMPRPQAANFKLAYKRWPERMVKALEDMSIPLIDWAFARPSGVQLYHNLGGAPPRLSVPTVATIYDLMPEVFHERAKARGENPPPLQASAGRLANRADRIITISAATRDDLVRFYGVSPAKISVVHLGVDHDLFKPRTNPAALSNCRRRYGLPDKYLLFVGPFEYRRNAEAGLTALAALKRGGLGLDCGAVLVGRENEYSQKLKALIGSLGIDREVVFTGFVPREDLPLLYSQALAFVHPEHYDGFSLQLLEAMACGAPAVISDAPALTEIAQGDALVASIEAASVETQLARLFREPGLFQEQRKRSLSRAAAFSWKRTAEQTAAIYDELL